MWRVRSDRSGSPNDLCVCVLFVAGKSRNFGLCASVVLAPLVDGLLARVGHQLALDAAENADGGLGGQDDGLDDDGRDLAQDAAHCARHALLLGLLVGHAHQRLCRLAQTLHPRKPTSISSSTTRA